MKLMQVLVQNVFLIIPGQNSVTSKRSIKKRTKIKGLAWRVLLKVFKSKANPSTEVTAAPLGSTTNETRTRLF